MVLFKLKFKYQIIFNLILFLIGFNAFSQNFNSQVEAIINTGENTNEVTELIASAKNLTETNFSLKYEFSVISTSSTNNSSKSVQSGRFTLEPFQSKNLATTTIGISPSQNKVVLLIIYNDEDEVMGTKRLVFDDKETSDLKKEEANVSYKRKNEGLNLKGMVTESTKTKPGKDFYDFFSQKYRLSSSQGDQIIHIDEMISFGRTTKIIVKIEDKIIFQFFARPKLDYLEEKADEALRQVNRYFEYIKNRDMSINQY